MSYELRYYDIVIRRHIPSLPKTMRERIRAALDERLTVDPISYGKPLRGSLKGHRRMRVGDYRVIYRIAVDQKRIDIVAIAHRKDIYEDF